MVVRKGDQWGMSDGIDGSTGQGFTAARMDLINAVADGLQD